MKSFAALWFVAASPAPLAALSAEGSAEESAEQREAAPEVFVPDDREVYDAVGYAPAVRVGDMLYLSGVTGDPVARDADDAALEANFVSIFEQIEATLDTAGIGFDQVVLLRSYRLHFERTFPLFNEVKKRYLKEPYPVWTDVGVSDLIPGAVAELEVQAWLGGKRREAK